VIGSGARKVKCDQSEIISSAIANFSQTKVRIAAVAIVSRQPP
jgi:hypothetical protein